MDIDDANHRLVALGMQLEKDLNNWEAWAAKADILCSIGMHDVAIRCCERALSLNPSNILTWMTKGLALEKLGKHDEAKAAFAKARELGHIG